MEAEGNVLIQMLRSYGLANRICEHKEEDIVDNVCLIYIGPAVVAGDQAHDDLSFVGFDKGLPSGGIAHPAIPSVAHQGNP